MTDLMIHEAIQEGAIRLAVRNGDEPEIAVCHLNAESFT